jgi:hypothetical protein
MISIDDVLAKIKADLAYRTPNLDMPLGHIVLTREAAEVLDRWATVQRERQQEP